MRLFSARSALLPILLLVVGCKAGPSVFDRSAAAGTASAATARSDSARGTTAPARPSPSGGEANGALRVDSGAYGQASRRVRSGDRAATDSSAAPRTGHRSEVPSAGAAATAPAAAAEPHFVRPEHVRGLYLNAWTAGSQRKVARLLALARRTEINTFVMDMKDASGYVSYASRVPLAVASGATGQIRIHDLRALLERLEKAGIYPIARIVVMKDPVLSRARPDLAIQSSAGGVWRDDKGVSWLNPYDHRVWDYAVALAREVVGYGFPEIQWDYVRFPGAPDSILSRAVYPGSDGRTKAEAIRGFLAYSRKVLHPLGARVTADVFGVTASAHRGVGIGQVWTSFINTVDVAMPMVYPSLYYAGSFGYENPNAYPYEVVRHALTDALRQSSEVKGAGATRPWLQDFTLGRPRYGAPEVRAEIQATYDVGIQGWILWNPKSDYTEAALEPVGGFRKEPLIRVGGRIVPVSRRFEVLDEEAAARAAAARGRRKLQGRDSAGPPAARHRVPPAKGSKGRAINPR